MSIDFENIKIAVAGGDCRQLYCARSFADKGFETALFGFDYCEDDIGQCTRCDTLDCALNKANIVVLPLPVSRDGENLTVQHSIGSVSLDELFSKIGASATVLGGNVSDKVKKTAESHGIKIIDYFEREELVIANAYLTAESAIAVAMNELDFSLHDYPVLVMGYGRIGKCLCQLLKGMGASVFASARKNRDFEWIRAFGYSPVDTSRVSEVVSSCRLVFNTIPETVLDENTLKYVHKDSLIIDLASKPGGVDFDSAKIHGIKVIWALSLPGKKLKISAGRAIAETVMNILEDEEVV